MGSFQSHDAWAFVANERAFCVLALLASLACSSNGGGGDSPANTGGQATTGGATSSGGVGVDATNGVGGTTSSTSTAGAEATTNGGVGTANVGAGGNGSGASTTGVGGAATSGVATGSGGVGGTGGGGTGDTVIRTESTYTFRHFPIEAADSFVWNGAENAAMQATSTTFDTVVLENGYLKVTLLPDYGGRVLSIVHKPTGRELLYQNPLGTPYLMYEDIFYYDYLVVFGGIFPSFPEPEHGKYWNQPYTLEVVSESAEAITVRMSRQDDLELVEGVPDAYDVGRTDILVEVDVTLRAGRASLDIDTKLTNTRNSAVPQFEYWTVTTLAPGSTPGETAIPLNTRIVAAMDQVHLLESSWSWFGDAEERVADEVFRWNNLSHFENWVDQGTGFANPKYSANYSGLLNEDEHMGVLRVSDNVQTPGLKLWTFGTQSLSIDINDSSEWLRPTIELWHGVTPEFWDRASMTPNEVKQWSDTYFATLGLSEITAASEYGAVQLTHQESGADTVLTAAATLTLPDQTVRAVLRLDGNVISEQEVVVQATAATTVSATLATSELAPGANFEAEFLQGDTSLLTGQVAIP